jgi:hypothetical protein
VFHWGRKIQTLPRAHTFLALPLLICEVRFGRGWARTVRVSQYLCAIKRPEMYGSPFCLEPGSLRYVHNWLMSALNLR